LSDSCCASLSDQTKLCAFAEHGHNTQIAVRTMEVRTNDILLLQE
jgi:hypothetical protein